MFQLVTENLTLGHGVGSVYPLPENLEGISYKSLYILKTAYMISITLLFLGRPRVHAAPYNLLGIDCFCSLFFGVLEQFYSISKIAWNLFGKDLGKHVKSPGKIVSPVRPLLHADNLVKFRASTALVNRPVSDTHTHTETHMH